MLVSNLKSRLLLLAFLGTLIAPSSAANATKELCHPSDKRALLRLKQQLINTSINDLRSWDPATDCCTWTPFGSIRCDPSTNRVNWLFLVGFDLVGPQIPSAIGNLPFLTSLTLHNKFSGPIPAFLAKLRRLTHVDFSRNLLSGPIPSFFGTFPILTDLYLSNNLLTGPIPPGLAEVAPIERLLLDNNRLTGTIPESLANFKTDNSISITLSNNNLSGEIPRSFDKDKFGGLEFDGNRLEGDPSFLFGKDKTQMGFLHLEDNSFSFDMTNLSVTTRLLGLFLDRNKIYGSLPEGLGRIPDFIYFNISNNMITGPIPESFGSFNQADQMMLSLANNRLSGEVPRSLGRLNCSTLDLSGNRLEGDPSFLFSMDKWELTYLDLSGNSFSFDMTNLSFGRRLQFLFLNNNKIYGSLPEAPLDGIPHFITYFNVSNNMLTGPIPEGFASFNKADEMMLSLANNRFSGEIPRSLEMLRFSTLDLSGNRLEGDPSFLFSKDKIELSYLDLSGNSFSFDTTNLSFTKTLEFLFLNNNKIYGSLPEGLAHITNLNRFNVSYNRLCGRIPSGKPLKKFNETSYLHNKCLCGHPLPPCRN